MQPVPPFLAGALGEHHRGEGGGQGRGDHQAAAGAHGRSHRGRHGPRGARGPCGRGSQGRGARPVHHAVQGDQHKRQEAQPGRRVARAAASLAVFGHPPEAVGQFRKAAVTGCVQVAAPAGAGDTAQEPFVQP